MEADIVLKEDEIEKSFEAASSDFLSYLDKSIERLEDEGFRGPVRKIRPRQMEEEYDARAYQQAATYHAYARELCENYSFDLRKYRFCVNQKRYAAITKSDFGKLKEDLC